MPALEQSKYVTLHKFLESFGLKITFHWLFQPWNSFIFCILLDFSQIISTSSTAAASPLLPRVGPLHFSGGRHGE